MTTRSHRQPSIWKIPLALAAATAVALTVALFFEGAADFGSALLLIVPGAVLAGCLYRAHRS